MKINIRQKLPGIEHPRTQYQNALNIYIQAYTTTISIHKALIAYKEQSKLSKQLKNTQNIPLIDKGDVREKVEMQKMHQTPLM